MDRGDWWATVHGVAKSWTGPSEKHFHFFFFFFILLSTETLPYVKSLLLHVFLRNSQGISHILSIRVLFYSAQAPTLYYTYLYLIENL